MSKFFRFGRYLAEKGLITTDAIIKARVLQKRNNRMIGELAKDKGWLTDNDILRILVIQEETCEKFGEIAVKEKYLTEGQIDERGGRVCLDNLKQFLSDKLLQLMPLPVSEVVYSSKPHLVFCRQVPDVAASDYKTRNTL